MTNPTQANVRIKVKDMHEDERELFGMLKSAYKDYWQTKNDGQPRISDSEGNYWVLESRVHSMTDGQPLIEKKVFYKKPNGEKIQVDDKQRSPEGTFNKGLERQREIIEGMAFLSSGYEAHERSIGDIIRIDENAQMLDVFHIGREGRQTRDRLARDYANINDTPQDYEVVNWQVVSPEMENWQTLKEELSLARKSGAQLEIPPTDGGWRRFENNEPEQSSSEGMRSQPDERIKFG